MRDWLGQAFGNSKAGVRRGGAGADAGCGETVPYLPRCGRPTPSSHPSNGTRKHIVVWGNKMAPADAVAGPALGDTGADLISSRSPIHGGKAERKMTHRVPPLAPQGEGKGRHAETDRPRCAASARMAWSLAACPLMVQPPASGV